MEILSVLTGCSIKIDICDTRPFIAVLSGALFCGDGQSNWYKGVQLITVYAIIALMFYLIPVLT